METIARNTISPKIRKDFPTINAKNIYLDSVASSLTPIPVIEAMNEYYYKYRANVHRGKYDLSMQASQMYNDSLEKIAAFINAKVSEIVITSNASHAINLAALSLPLQAGDEVIISSLEHTSNLIPWLRLSKLNGIKIKFYNPGKEGLFNMEEFRNLISSKTKVVALTYVSNVLGSLVPVKEVAEICTGKNIYYLVDACQAAPHMPIDVRSINCDFLAFSGHKMLGPTGVGVLFVKEHLADELTPGIVGGGAIDTSQCHCESLETCNIDACTFNDLPFKWQAGTPPIAEVIGLAKAIDYLKVIGMKNIQEHCDYLVEMAMDGLSKIEGVDIFGPLKASERHAIVSFNIYNLNPEEVGRILSENFKIAVRSGQHCAVNYFRDVQIPDQAAGNVRASFYLYNTEDEVNQFVAAVEQIALTIKS